MRFLRTTLLGGLLCFSLIFSPAVLADVIRISSGIYIARTPGNLLQRVFTDNGLTTVAVDTKFDSSVFNVLHFPDPLTGVPPNLKIAAPRVFGFESGFRNPRSFQAAATVEQDLGHSLSLSASYVRNSTWNLQRRLNRNLFPPTIDATGMPIFPSFRPNPAIGWLSVNESSAHASYDATVLNVTRRFGQRFQLQAGYTLAYAHDDDSNERLFRQEPTLDPYDLTLERGYSKQDVRHHGNISGWVDLPHGFTFGAIMMARSGFPYTPIIGFDTQNDGNDDNDRAIINGRVAQRNSFRQPTFFDLDLRLLKSFRVSDQHRIELTAEVFNATRSPNKNFGADSVSAFGTPAAPVASAGIPLFAPSTARYGGPRQLELGLRYRF